MMIKELNISFHRTFIFLFLINSLTGIPLSAQYWQQKVQYSIKLSLDSKLHQYTAIQNLRYYNNSPDTLKEVYYHLYFNAFQPESEMDIRSRSIADPDPRIADRISKLTKEEEGFIKVKKLKQGSRQLKFKELGTILKVRLHEPCLPGQFIELEMDYLAQIPIQIRRSGRNNKEGIDYSMAQWYPKICNYDKKGWHTNPYIGREFYGVWGDFDVSITLDSSYVLAYSGVLKNPGRGPCSKPEPDRNKSTRTWNIEAKNVHDFVWAADPDYTCNEYLRANGCLLRFYYKPSSKTNDSWSKLPTIIDTALNFIEEKFGPYPYPVYSFIQGGDGGMEYPLATLITGNRPLISLVGVSIHELMHSWYHMMLASNESLYPWMDEGFTSYAEEEVMNFLKQKKLIPGEPVADVHGNTLQSYIAVARAGKEEALSTHADHYKTNSAYGFGAYTKGAVCLIQLKYILGEEMFDKGMLDYYWKWRFKHPEPDDFFSCMEKTSGINLDWFQLNFINTTNTIDYAIDTLYENGSKTICRLRNNSNFPMPVELSVLEQSGHIHYFYIPLSVMNNCKKFNENTEIKILKPWSVVNPYYEFEIDLPLSKITNVLLNPSKQMADINLINDIYFISKSQ